MGLRDLKRKLQFGLAVKRAIDYVEEEAKVGKFLPAVVAVIGATLTAIVANIWAACPELKEQWVAILISGMGGAFATYALKPREGLVWKAILTGVLTTTGAAVFAKVGTLCPDLMAQLPQLIMTGIVTGVGLTIKGNSDRKLERVAKSEDAGKSGLDPWRK